MEVTRDMHFKAEDHYKGANTRSAAWTWAVQRCAQWHRTQLSSERGDGWVALELLHLVFFPGIFEAIMVLAQFTEMFGAGLFVTSHTCHWSPPSSAI